MVAALAGLDRLYTAPRVQLCCLPTPLQRLPRLSAVLGGPEIWIKRDDLSGGGNKTRKLEFVLPDALERGATVLVTVGAVQSNHTRQTAAAAARLGLRCALLHNGWVGNPICVGRVGNPLLSSLFGAELYHDRTERPVGDEGELSALAEELRARGEQPFVIPGGASEHPAGGLGYALCADEILRQSQELGVEFDAIVHCTGSGSTQAGLLAGLAAFGSSIRVIGVADDDETAEKQQLVLRLANATLDRLGVASTVSVENVAVIAADPSPYGTAAPETVAAIRLLAECEGLIADPVYEGKAVLGLTQLIREGVLPARGRVLLLHLGGTPAVHAYAEQLWSSAHWLG